MKTEASNAKEEGKTSVREDKSLIRGRGKGMFRGRGRSRGRCRSFGQRQAPGEYESYKGHIQSYCLAAHLRWPIYQFDLKSAFSNGEMKDVYVDQLEEYVEASNEHKVYKLHKALYGL